MSNIKFQGEAFEKGFEEAMLEEKNSSPRYNPFTVVNEKIKQKITSIQTVIDLDYKDQKKKREFSS